MDPESFHSTFLPHLDAAYNLARWLLGRGEDAEDAVQDAYLRAHQAFPGFRGQNPKAWLLAIVRNLCLTGLRRRGQAGGAATAFDEEVHGTVDAGAPEALEAARLRRAVEALPVEFREVLVLREWEGHSYKEISEIMDIPMGTVMSRLVRARERLQESLSRPRGRT